MKSFLFRKLSGYAFVHLCLISLFFISSLSANEEVEVELTTKGKFLEAKYSKELNRLRKELIAVLPALAQEKYAKDDAVKKKAEEEDRKRKTGPEFNADLSLLDGDSEFDDDLALPEPKNKKKKEEPKIGYEIIITAYSKFNASEKKLSQVAKSDPVQRYEGALARTKRGIENCIKGLAKTKSSLNTAKDDFARKKIENSIASWKKKHESGLKSLKDLQAKLKEAIDNKAAYKKSVADAFEQYKMAKKNLEEMTEKTGVSKVLREDKLDAKLIKYVVLYTGQPRALAEFAEKSAENEALIESLLNNNALMKQMLIADGPGFKSSGRGKVAGPAQFGRAMKIYTDIQKASPKAQEGRFQLLALAIALEHAVPIRQGNPKNDKNAPEFVDPVERYLYFETNSQNGELDPAFNNLTVWEYRHAVNGDEPNETMDWGRQTLRNYNPSLIHMDHESWRYVSMVSACVTYGSGDVKYDLPELQQYQNILMNGGICGRRAFFGRFILRSFGIPTIKRPSKAHGALARWTSKGWVVCYGPGWGSGWTDRKYRSDKDFLATSQARKNLDKFLHVKRAQWIGDVFEEPRVYGAVAAEQYKPKFWNEISIKTQTAVIQSSKVETLNAIGEHLGESNSNDLRVEKKEEKEPIAKSIKYNKDNSILIDAAAYNEGNMVGVSPIRSFDSGSQIILKGVGLVGLTVMRGNYSGWRMKSGGYGRYPGWGFRVAMSYSGSNAPKEMTIEVVDGVKMEFVYIKPGSFIMGGENNTDGRFDSVELPKHGVTLTKGYYLGKYEVTQKQFEAVMGYNFKHKEEETPDHPAHNVDWTSSLKFCELVSSYSKRKVRLPSEAEWEYAARAGTKTKWFFGDDESKLGEYGWVGDDTKEYNYYAVGRKKPNPWGLYDIYGNVIERTADIYDKDYYANSPETDPKGPSQPVQVYFEYEIDAKQAGTYELSANIVTYKHSQFLSIATNDSKFTHVKLPFTLGEWGVSKPIEVNLVQGKNILKIKRIHPPQKGVAIKTFSLKPVK